MSRRLLWILPLAVVACTGVDTTTPSAQNPVPSLAISDGAHTAGNADFFFLPPVVLPTGPLTNWTRNGFNPSLSPSVEICPLNVTSASAVTATTPCKATAGFPVVISGPAVLKHFPPSANPTDALSGLPDDWAHYHAQWRVPNPCNVVYRVTVKVGTVTLGFADVQCVTSILGLLTIDYKKFGPALRGLPLQIPFRIEQYALCAVPGVGPCGSSTISTAAGGTSSFTPPGGTEPDAVIVPPQPPAPPGQPALPAEVTLTVSSCPPLNPRATDLPVFGDCIRIVSNPALPPAGLTAAATVLVCNLQINLAADVFSHNQEHRITMHRLDVDPTTGVQTLAALPHVAGCAVHETDAGGTLTGVLAALVHGKVTAAGNQLLSLIGPNPLYARRLNQGGGGLTKGFSDFGYALPTQMTILSGDGQVAAPGAILPANPTVMLTDIGGEPVAGARVTFTPSADGTATPTVVLSAADGSAGTQWKLKTADGGNALVASGRGIAGSDNNGPRPGLDPFQPFQSPFDVTGPIGSLASEVTVLTGSQTFGATGVSGDPLPINYLSGGWSYQIDGTIPADWNANLVSPFSTTGAAGFGFFNPTDECSLIGAHTNTPWAPNTMLYARKNIALTSAGMLQISVAIDNDVQIFVDGNDIGGGLISHDGCPTQGSIVRTTPTLPAGTHVIAFRAVDRGGSTYFDAEIMVAPPSF